MNIDFNAALKNAAQNKSGRKFPDREDDRYQDGVLFPEFKPGFSIEPGAALFTIGSCFARNIEEALQPLGFQLPTTAFVSPKSEWSGRSNGLLNEYNPGTIAQRIGYALEGQQTPEATIVPSGSLYADLMLMGGAADVTRERALERRNEIFSVYENLARSPYIVITLGFIEAWFDNETRLFINRIPPRAFKDSDPGRFTLKVLDVSESMALLEPALAALADHGCKVVLTLSPVPIQSTFTSNDCVTANEYSKAVLRVCSEQLCKRFANVDYFPSYEIVRSGGLVNYGIDNVHVKNEVVKKITALMIKKYSQPSQ